MGERVSKIVLLIEDVNQENLIRRFLHRLGHSNRAIRVNRVLSGYGSGEQYVRQEYAAQVRAIRSQASRTKACLIAMIDADALSVEQRFKQLERALEDAEEASRGVSDPILVLIARRNVETWILCLNGERVDEEADYRHHQAVNAHSIQNAALTLFEWTRPNCVIPDTCVPSLEAGLDEFRRIPK